MSTGTSTHVGAGTESISTTVPANGDNALISSRERLPSWAAIGVESRTAHVGPSEYFLLSSPADPARGYRALVPILRPHEATFGARYCGSDLLRGRLGPERLWWRRLGLAVCALRPERHATQPHEVGLETQPLPSPHRRRQERTEGGPRREHCRRPNPHGPLKIKSGSDHPSSARGAP